MKRCFEYSPFTVVSNISRTPPKFYVQDIPPPHTNEAQKITPEKPMLRVPPEWRGGGNGRSQRKTRRPTASSGTIPTCENPVTRPGIEPGSPWWEASRLTAQRPWPLFAEQPASFLARRGAIEQSVVDENLGPLVAPAHVLSFALLSRTCRLFTTPEVDDPRASLTHPHPKIDCSGTTGSCVGITPGTPTCAPHWRDSSNDVVEYTIHEIPPRVKVRRVTQTCASRLIVASRCKSTKWHVVFKLITRLYETFRGLTSHPNQLYVCMVRSPLPIPRRPSVRLLATSEEAVAIVCSPQQLCWTTGSEVATVQLSSGVAHLRGRTYCYMRHLIMPPGSVERGTVRVPDVLCREGKPYPRRAPVAKRLDCSLPTKANRVQFLGGSLPDFRKWESCRTMPLVGSFLGGLPFPRPSITALLHTHLASPSSALNISILRAAQISLPHSKQDISFKGCSRLIPFTRTPMKPSRKSRKLNSQPECDLGYCARSPPKESRHAVKTELSLLFRATRASEGRCGGESNNLRRQRRLQQPAAACRHIKPIISRAFLTFGRLNFCAYLKECSGFIP
ncbi:hypothetical protein PR048_000701 [Dryococelus australis]|uniref:Uncharacterized protein n=1 Tax=Dryococelus australis TaxID=614101 RepID=A0ABQ9IFC2_9NEOP|nr:hypothetical protein PR048_000701 [Dryococelus australis]